MGEYRSSRLWHCLPATPRDWFQSAQRLPSLGLETKSDPWRTCLDHWANIAATRDDDRTGRGAYSGGWAIGPAGWRRASARQPAQLALSPETSATEIAEITCARWPQALDAAFKEAGKSLADAASAPKGVGWKVAIARTR